MTEFDEAAAALVAPKDGAAGVNAIKELLERNGIDPAEIGRVQRVNLWQGMIKNAEGEPEVVDLAGVVLSPKWEDGPEWPVIQPGPPVKPPPAKATKTGTDGWKRAPIWPDMQIGYYRTNEGLVATHDEDAIELALAITKSLNPNLVVLVGDNLDLPEMGKYRLSPAFQRTTQDAIDYATTLMGRIRAAAPNARIVWLAGNHEERMVNYLLDNAGAAFGLRQGRRPEGWPVLSVPHLCRLDDVGVEYLAGYPAGKFWINERLKVIHGSRVKSNGSTAHLYLANEKTSVIFGHIHRREWAEQTFDKWDGPKTILAASPGCLAKISGAVPSTKGSIDLDGRPLTVVEDWQQGIAVVTYEDTGDHRFFYEQVPFHAGEAMYGGRIYRSAA